MQTPPALGSYLVRRGWRGRSSASRRCWWPRTRTCPGPILRSALSGELLVGNSTEGRQGSAGETSPASAADKHTQQEMTFLSSGPTSAAFGSSFFLSFRRYRKSLDCASDSATLHLRLRARSSLETCCPSVAEG